MDVLRERRIQERREGHKLRAHRLQCDEAGLIDEGERGVPGQADPQAAETLRKRRWRRLDGLYAARNRPQRVDIQPLLTPASMIRICIPPPAQSSLQQEYSTAPSAVTSAEGS